MRILYFHSNNDEKNNRVIIFVSKSPPPPVVFTSYTPSFINSQDTPLLLISLFTFVVLRRVVLRREIQNQNVIISFFETFLFQFQLFPGDQEIPD